MARFNAKDMKGYTTSGGTDTLITHTDSCEITFSTETIDITTKDSNGWKEILPGLKSGTGSITGKVDYEGTNQVKALTTAHNAGTLITWKFKTATVGDSTYAWSGYVTSIPLTFGNNEAATFSCDIEFTGAPTVSTYTS